MILVLFMITRGNEYAKCSRPFQTVLNSIVALLTFSCLMIAMKLDVLKSSSSALSCY